MKTVDDIIKEKVLKGGFTRDDLIDIARFRNFINEVAEEYANQCKHRYTSADTHECLHCHEKV